MVSEARKAWISVAYGRPGDSYAFERFTHTAAAWIGEPWRVPFVAPNYLGGGDSPEDARSRARGAVCGHGGEVVVVDIPAAWAQAARFAQRGQPPWPEGRKAKRDAAEESFRRRYGESDKSRAQPHVVHSASPQDLLAFLALGLLPGATELDVRRAFKRLAAAAHPDHGGTDAAFIELTAARDRAIVAAR